MALHRHYQSGRYHPGRPVVLGMDAAPSAAPNPVSGLDIPLTITFFQDEHASWKKEEVGTLRELAPIVRDTNGATKALLPWLKLAQFGDFRKKTSLRNNANVVSISGVEADYDGESLTLRHAQQVLMQAGIAGIIYTSPSHEPHKPRWRILCPTSVTCPPSDRTRFLARVNGLFAGALADESFALSQSYYYGYITGRTGHQVILVEGRPIDMAPELDAGAIAKIVREKPGPGDAAPFVAPTLAGEMSNYAKAALHNVCSDIVNAPDGGKHHALNKGAYSIGGLVSGGAIDEHTVMASLSAALDAIRHRCNDFKHAQDTLRQAFEDGMATPRTVEPQAAAFDVESLGIFRAKECPNDPASANGHDPDPEDWDAAFNAPPPQPPKPKEVLWIDAEDPTVEAIPLRPWAVPAYLMRGSVTVLSGQGAGGKSSLVVAWTLAMARGKAIGDFVPPRPMLAVNYNVEDDQDEQRRRYSAAMLAQEATGDVVRRVIRCGPHDIGTLFERDDKGRLVGTAALQRLAKLVSESGADVLICDPLAELHTEEENDNTAMRAVVAAFRSMAKRLDIAIMLLHHDRKGTNAPGDMDRMRGASAITGAVRVMMTLTVMSQEEADKFGIPAEDRRRHFRVDGAKSNYAIAAEAEWWKLTGYQIPNGETVAAAMPWEPPGAFDGISLQTCVSVLDAMHRGINGAPYGSQARARGELFSMMEAEPFNIPKQRAAALIQAWLASGTIHENPYCQSPNSNHKRAGYVVNTEKVAEMRRGI